MAPRRLGELLVAKGKLTGEQLQKALQAQMIWGGHLGTNLIELGFLTEDELGEVLAEAHAVRYAPYEILQDIPASVLASVPRGLVEKYKIVPFRFDGKKLHLVMLTPQDLTALDEVSFATGFQLVPYVTPEIRLFQILEKHYSIPRTKRYITLSRELSLRGQKGTTRGAAEPASVPAPDRPIPASSILDDADHPHARKLARPAGPEAPSASRQPAPPPEPEAADLPPPSASAATDWAPRGLGDAASRGGTASAHAELVPEPVEEGPETSAQEKIFDRLLRAQTLEQVCGALIEHAAGTFRRCAIFARSGEGFLSVAGLSASSPTWSIEGLQLPFAPAAAEALFADRRTYYIGPPPGGSEETRFYERLGTAAPPNAFLAPVRLNERVALVFYGDDIDAEIRPRDVEGILALLQQASLALDLLALRRKDSPA